MSAKVDAMTWAVEMIKSAEATREAMRHLSERASNLCTTIHAGMSSLRLSQDTRIDELRQDLGSLEISLRRDMKRLSTAIDKRFDGVDERFDEVDDRFRSVELRFDMVDQRLDGMDQRFDGMDQRFDGFEATVDRVLGALQLRGEQDGEDGGKQPN